MLDLATIACEFEHDRTVNYAVQQNHVPVVKRLRLTNAGVEDLGQLEVTITAEPAFALKWETTVASLRVGQTVDLGVVDLQLSPIFLGSLCERIAGSLTLTVSEGEDQLYTTQSSIDVLAYDEWNGTQTLPEIIAAFVMPNHPDVSRILRAAADYLQEWTGNPALDGYQSKDPSRVRKQLAAIYKALQAWEIAYCVPPASFEEQGQKIRTPDVIRQHRLGTCLDLSVLFAACAEAAGLHSLIMITQGHAFPGVWLVEESFAESLQDDITLLTKRVAAGVEEICVVEATAFCAGNHCSFDDAVAKGEAHLLDPEQFHFLVDIRRARASHIRPLPVRTPGQLPAGDGIAEVWPPAPGTDVPEEMDPLIVITQEANNGGERTRLEQWKRRLLDLSLRNPLINFRVTGSSIPLLTADLHYIEDALADGLDFQIHPRPWEWDATPRNAAVFQSRTNSDPQVELLRNEFTQHRLRADLAEKELGNRLTQLYRAARTSLEENGANTLYLALGMLVWYESDASQKPRCAPILLLPMEIVRKSVQTGYLVREGEDEPQLNVTLMEMLRQDFGIDVQGLNPLPTDDHGVDVRRILTTLRRAVMQKARWDVIETAYLGLFSFSKFVMWYDLKARGEELKRNKVVASLMAGSLQWTPEGAGPNSADLDTAFHPKDVACPISADSSQLAAVCAAREGKSVVLHGPPGTGKSQTITNIIAHALAQGKSVLFVAEKMAALTVVQRRLEQIGLAPFCLEVHSNKSKKKDVLEQLRKALEIGRVGNPQNWQEEANRLAVLRDELNSYVRALHQERSVGHSVFQGLSRLAAVRHAPLVVAFEAAQVAGLTSGTLRTWTDLARQLRVAGEGCGHPHGHTWSASNRQDYVPQLRTQAANALSTLRSAVEGWKETVPAVAKLFQVSDKEESYLVLFALLELAKRFLAMPTMPGTLVREREWNEVRTVVDEWIAHGRARDSLRLEVFARYDNRVMQLDITSLREGLRQVDQQWFLPRLLGRRRVTKTLRSAMKPRTQLRGDQLETELTRLQLLHEEERILSSASDRAREMFGRLWLDGNADWDEVAGACQWTSEVRKLAAAIAGTDLVRMENLREHWAQVMAEYREQLNPDGVLGRQLYAFTEGGNAVLSAWQTLSQLLTIDQSALMNALQTDGWFSAVLAQIAKWEVGLDSLRDWCAWTRARTQAVDAGLLSLVAPYEQGKLTHAAVEPAFLRGLYQAWSEQEIGQDPCLSSFSRGLFEDKIRQFKDLDDNFAQLTCREIYARLAERVPRTNGDPAQNSEMGILGRELQKKRNHLSLRTLFQRIPNVLTRLKPCLLMSPISVAQYLDPSHPPFDLVIFDEASQVPTCDAVGAIARGREVFVVGDPKQLPPTSFFTRINIEEDDEESLAIQDLESILDDCLAIRMPEQHLRWHYRSQHESLIAFSNHQYYDNGLLTFPSPDDLTPAVSWCPVDGFYDRGKTKQNRAEADAIVAEIIRRLRDPELCQRSIGVVTFSQVQQRLIEDLLDDQLRRAPDLERFFAAEAIEPVFVKNLENVQGDERDVILFSIGFGPDPQGRITLNFGPLNQEGGWRRLNVAVSRARQEMLVFSILRADQLDSSRINAKGVADLKGFLEFAVRGKNALYTRRTMTADAEHESLFEEQVGQVLRQRGHEVHLQVGCSGYRLDLAVVDSDHPGRYLLGIECDGATYHRAKTARDRDKLREMVLRQLGWQIHRVWSTDWWENPEREIDRIEESIRSARQRKSVSYSPATTIPAISSPRHSVPVSQAMIPSPPEIPQRLVTAAVPYTICPLPKATRAQDEFYLPTTTRIIEGQIAQVVNAEGPISYGLLSRRIAQAWGMSKVGHRIDARIRDVCAEMTVRATRSGTVIFFWPQTIDPNQYSLFRVPGEDKQTRRDAEDLPPEEVANAALEVLRGQISLPEADLIREVARLFGFQRLGTSVEQNVRYGIAHLIQRGNASRDSEGRVVHVE